MDFSSLLFIFVFFPLMLGSYLLAYHFENEKRLISRLILLIGSIVFYAFNSTIISLVIVVGAAFCHYLMAYLIQKYKSDKKICSKVLLGIDLAISIVLLIFFKYCNLFSFGKNILFPLALSFITFHFISFAVDIYKEEIDFKNTTILSYFSYIFVFMKLVEGPIVSYSNLNPSKPTVDGLFDGMVRFYFGLAKKVLIADTLIQVVSATLSEVEYVGTSISWLCIICFTVQLLFDFSGYIDMGIGLGMMFGFKLPENFNNPYLSTSIRDFWRRWHITLSVWFKKYIYIPLGGNRKGTFRTLLNLLIIFVLTGLWHGSTINYLIWGLYFGFFMIIERLFLGKLLDKNPVKIINWLYSIFVVMMGWVLFICPTITDIGYFYRNLFSYQENISSFSLNGLLNFKVLVSIIIGILFATIIPYCLDKFWPQRKDNKWWIISKAVVGMALFIICVVFITSNNYSPSLYGGF